MYVCSYIILHMYMYIHIYIHTYTHTHTCMPYVIYRLNKKTMKKKKVGFVLECIGFACGFHCLMAFLKAVSVESFSHLLAKFPNFRFQSGESFCTM